MTVNSPLTTVGAPLGLSDHVTFFVARKTSNNDHDDIPVIGLISYIGLYCCFLMPLLFGTSLTLGESFTSSFHPNKLPETSPEKLFVKKSSWLKYSL
jgi:hypothetical protein